MSDERPNDQEEVIVGVDGSGPSHAALEWAMHYAAATGGHVRAVTAWHFPQSYGYPMSFGEIDLEGAAKEVAGQVVAEAHERYPAIELVLEVIEGPSAVALLGAAEHASLLVVGSHGHGAFAGMLLGSVSAHVVHHCPCPVVIVREPAESEHSS